ncbi:MAG: hypothetical protein AAF702_49225 [Chloroflexota bacterium]
MGNLLTAIFGKRVLKQVSSTVYADWAVQMLIQGHDTHSLRILAGLDRFASTYEAEEYFLRTVKELHLTLPDSDTAIRSYACEIAQNIVDGEISGKEGIRMLSQICLDMDYPHDYLVWFHLDDALDSLLHGHYPVTYESLTLENVDQVAKREAENFIKIVG